MIKNILVYTIVFLLLYIVAYNLHALILLNNEINLTFSLEKVYLFHALFSMLICVNFQFFSTVDKIFEQLGFIYLAALFLKIIIFCLTFYRTLFYEDNLPESARISLFIPMIIFLLTEAFFVAKILNKKEYKKIP